MSHPEYTTEVALELLSTLEVFDSKSLEELLKLLEETWNHDCGYLKFTGSKKNRRLYLATGGWSGNEDIIRALRSNYLFWAMFWYQSRSGGAFWFKFFEIK